MRLTSEDMGAAPLGPTPLLVDNDGTYKMVINPGATARTRFYDRKTNFVRKAHFDLVTVLFLVSTDDMMADYGTKATDPNTFYKNRRYSMNLSNATDPNPTGKVFRLIDRLMRHLPEKDE